MMAKNVDSVAENHGAWRVRGMVDVGTLASTHHPYSLCTSVFPCYDHHQTKSRAGRLAAEKVDAWTRQRCSKVHSVSPTSLWHSTIFDASEGLAAFCIDPKPRTQGFQGQFSIFFNAFFNACILPQLKRLRGSSTLCSVVLAGSIRIRVSSPDLSEIRS